MVLQKSMIITHVLVKKLQAADWSTEEAGSEAPSKICVGVFTPSTTEQRSTASKEVYDVKMDGQLRQSKTTALQLVKIFLSITRSIVSTMPSKPWRRS